MIHFRADYPSIWTPCQERATEVSWDSDRDRVTCPECIAALERADLRAADPEKRAL